MCFNYMTLKGRDLEMDAVILVLGIIAAMLYLYLCGRQKKAVKTMLLNSLLGVAALAAAAAVSGFLGCGIAVNYASVFVASVLGIPGVIGIIALMLFI